MSVLHKFKSIFKKDAAVKDAAANGKPKSLDASTLSRSGSGNNFGGGAHIWAMSNETKAALARGVKYNVKIAIRGMRRTGKTSLMLRLNGRPLASTYAATPEIAASTIYFPAGGGADTTEGAKIDLWEIVDEAQPVQQPVASASKVSPMSSSAADATTVDVYRGCTAVIFMVDAGRRETFEYVKRNIADVPQTIAILVCLNFSDVEVPRAVTDQDVDELCRHTPAAATRMVLDAAQGQPLPKDFAASACWMPCSMLSGDGVEAVKAFFDIPFALTQLETLENQMRGLYRGVEAVRADLLRQRAEARFATRQKVATPQSNTTQGGTASPPTQMPPTQLAPSPKGQQPVAASSQPPHKSQVSPQQAPPTQPLPAKQPAHQPASKPAAKPAKKSTSVDPGKLNDSFFDDLDDEEPAEDHGSDSQSEPTPPPPPALPPRRSSPQESQQRPPPAAASPVNNDTRPHSDSPKAQSAGDRSPSPQDPVPPRAVAKSVVAVPASLPSTTVRATPMASLPVSAQQSNEVNIVDTSVLAAQSVDDGFFGGSDDDEGDKPTPPPKLETPAPAEPSPPVAKAASSDEDVEDTKPAAIRGRGRGLVSTRREATVPVPKRVEPEPAAPAPSVDLSALMAQMASALAAPTQTADDEEEEPQVKAKKPKKDKTDKKDKADKKEKKSKRHAVEEAEDDDLVVVRD
jgi:GTPase SAR1 family protein